MPGFWDQFFGFGEEVTLGTGVARTEFTRFYEGSSIKLDKPREPRGFVGFRDPRHMRQNKPSSVAVKLISPVYYTGMGLLLKHLMGLVATSGSDPYTHSYTMDDSPFTRAAAPLIALTSEIHMALPTASAESVVAQAVRFTEFAFDVRVGEDAKLDVSGIGRGGLPAAKTASPTYPDLDDEEVVWEKVTVEIDTVATDIVGASVKVNNNLRTDRAFLGDLQMQAQLPASGKREVTGMLDKEWEDQDLFDAFVNKTEASLEILAAVGGASDYEFQINLPRVIYTGEMPDPVDGGVLPQSVPFTALYDSSAGHVMEIVQINNQASP